MLVLALNKSPSKLLWSFYGKGELLHINHYSSFSEVQAQAKTETLLPFSVAFAESELVFGSVEMTLR